MNNSIWTTNSSGSLANGEMGYDTSARIDQKRVHEWLMDASEQELFFNKKQALESVKTTQGAAVTNNFLGCDSSSSQSAGQIGDRLFSPKPVRYVNISGKNVPPVVSSDMNVQNKGLGEQFGNDSAICLSMSQAMEAPSYPNDGLRKVKVNEVISDNCLPEFINYPSAGEKNKVINSVSQMAGQDMFPGSTYNTPAARTMSMAPSLNLIEKDYISIGPESSKKSGNLMLTDQFYDGMSNNFLAMGPPYFNRGSYGINTIEDQYPKENGSIMSVGPAYSKGPESLFAMDSFYSNKMNENFMSAGSTYNKGPTDIMPMTSMQGQQQDVVPLGTLYDTENSGYLSMGQNIKKGEQTTISFGGFQDNLEGSDPSGRLISYNNFLSQSSGQSSGASGMKDAVQQLNENAVTVGTSDGTNKNKEQKGTKKAASNNFPSNVKSLLSTGILDGVPVKYVSWSREKNLRGVVKGTGYLCSCAECKLSKAINAYEFEKHAGCKTKHPNNHIYFENGKTIYAVVQELKSTPQDLLFEVIQTVTGSPINQKNFQAWKESFQAATRELRRIYGSGTVEVVMPSA